MGERALFRLEIRILENSVNEAPLCNLSFSFDQNDFTEAQQHKHTIDEQPTAQNTQNNEHEDYDTNILRTL
jgi:hypothetical protein